MLDLAARGSATFVGAHVERATSRNRAPRRREGRSRRAYRQFASRATTRLPPARSTLAIAIESLAHSPNPAATLAALAARLAARRLPRDRRRHAETRRRRHARPRAVQVGLAATRAARRRRARGRAQRCSLAVVWNHDLTAELRPRTLAAIARLEALNRALRRIAPSAGVRTLLDSYRGGLALERLYRARLMSYRLVVACRPGGKRHHAAATAKPNSVYAVVNTQAGAS